MQSCVATRSLWRSKRPCATYLNTSYEAVSMRRRTRASSGTGSSVRSPSGTRLWSAPPGVTPMPLRST